MYSTYTQSAYNDFVVQYLYQVQSKTRICEYVAYVCVWIAYLYLNGVFFRFTNYETTFRVWKIKREVYEKKTTIPTASQQPHMHKAHIPQSRKKKRDEGVPISDILMHFFKNYLMNTNSSLECKLLQSFVVLYWDCLALRLYVRVYLQIYILAIL